MYTFIKYSQQIMNKKHKIVNKTIWILTKQILNKKFTKENLPSAYNFFI